jgi:bacterioferritin-associated ferredoxin
MIVCHCRGISDQTIRACVRDGAQTVSEVGRRCGAGTGCGGCRRLVGAVVAEERLMRAIVPRADLELDPAASAA